jgi:phage baseplate assembly protein gpV
MNDAINNAIQRQVGKRLEQVANTRMARVTSYDPKTYSCTVLILPEGDFPDAGTSALSGWIPVQTSWSGNGWGVFCPPSVGDQVCVEHIEGDPGSGQIIGRVYDASHLPLAVQSGEFWLVHATDSFIKLTNDGKVTIDDQAGSTVTWNGDGTGFVTFAKGLTINAETALNGSLDVSGNVTVGTGASGTYTSLDGKTITVQDGITTNIY